MKKYTYEKYRARRRRLGITDKRPAARQRCAECDKVGHNTRTCPTLKVLS